jgi:hypothetical protein
LRRLTDFDGFTISISPIAFLDCTSPNFAPSLQGMKKTRCLKAGEKLDLGPT